MKQEKIFELVCTLVQENCAADGREILPDAFTPLIGAKRVMDSIGLVNLVADIEAAMLDAGEEITLMSEAAMSEKLSPFRSVGSLCGYIERQLQAKGTAEK